MKKLTGWIKSHGLSLDEFARRVGVTHAQLSRVINRKRRPSFQLMERIRAETNGEITPDDFFTTEDETADSHRTGTDG